MSERKIITPEMEITISYPQHGYRNLLAKMYNLRNARGLSNAEKTEKLQAILKEENDAEE